MSNRRFPNERPFEGFTPFHNETNDGIDRLGVLPPPPRRRFARDTGSQPTRPHPAPTFDRAGPSGYAFDTQEPFDLDSPLPFRTIENFEDYLHSLPSPPSGLVNIGTFDGPRYIHVGPRRENVPPPPYFANSEAYDGHLLYERDQVSLAGSFPDSVYNAGSWSHNAEPGDENDFICPQDPYEGSSAPRPDRLGHLYPRVDSPATHRPSFQASSSKQSRFAAKLAKADVKPFSENPFEGNTIPKPRYDSEGRVIAQSSSGGKGKARAVDPWAEEKIPAHTSPAKDTCKEKGCGDHRHKPTYHYSDYVRDHDRTASDRNIDTNPSSLPKGSKAAKKTHRSSSLSYLEDSIPPSMPQTHQEILEARARYLADEIKIQPEAMKIQERYFREDAKRAKKLIAKTREEYRLASKAVWMDKEHRLQAAYDDADVKTDTLRALENDIAQFLHQYGDVLSNNGRPSKLADIEEVEVSTKPQKQATKRDGANFSGPSGRRQKKSQSSASDKDSFFETWNGW
ncbi:hypothetical protein EJ08DRAFT_677106 [Tothia fuscella]|uniref:Uncharacterized protein n=1 Tax=Tothia fuscella TaxID=1048955 RepID=A0A9P4NWY6_9PEZI|nr:hypothetical protein EJ08DRAFT_677106 [Tothia fuscella]